MRRKKTCDDDDGTSNERLVKYKERLPQWVICVIPGLRFARAPPFGGTSLIETHWPGNLRKLSDQETLWSEHIRPCVVQPESQWKLGDQETQGNSVCQQGNTSRSLTLKLVRQEPLFKLIQTQLIETRQAETQRAKTLSLKPRQWNSVRSEHIETLCAGWCQNSVFRKLEEIQCRMQDCAPAAVNLWAHCWNSVCRKLGTIWSKLGWQWRWGHSAHKYV